MALPIGGIVAAGSSFLGGLFGGSSKDPERMAKNATAFTLAVTGNNEALKYLKARGNLGDQCIGAIPGLNSVEDTARGCDVIGRWASNTAVADAATKYNKALSLRGSAGNALVETGNALTGAGVGLQLDTAARGGPVPSWLLWAGGIAALLFVLKRA